MLISISGYIWNKILKGSDAPLWVSFLIFLIPFAFILSVYLGLGWLLMDGIHRIQIYNMFRLWPIPIWGAAVIIAFVPNMGKFVIPFWFITYAVITWILL